MYKQFTITYIARIFPLYVFKSHIMQLVQHLTEFKQIRKELPLHARIGLVPTMGALHQGHASLVKRSVLENDFTIVSIFVNPTQFGPNEDFSQYPRDLNKDAKLLKSLEVDLIFAPNVDDIYPSKGYFYFEINELANKLCGKSRPGHMNGVVQVVSILFHICQPTHAYFGLKDYQQCTILQHLVKELHFPLEIVPCPIVRESDGLAMSSRNVYLSEEERVQALFLSKTLQLVKEQFDSFQSIPEIQTLVQKQLENYPLVKLDYFEILHGENLENISDLQNDGPVHGFVAAFLGKTRLIDNLRIQD